MSTDISEEAKQALANRQLVIARGRLRNDGCSSDAAFQRRVLLLAAERGLPPAEYTKLMRKRCPMGPIGKFCKKHDVSLDWLMDGDLKGLQRMKQWAKQDQGVTAGEQTARILRKFRVLKPSYQKIILEWIDAAYAEEFPGEN
jgi:hypothetical protein